MRLLLDTHIFLWAVAGSRLLKPKARLGKIDADPQALVAAIEASGFMELPVRASHAAGVARLAMHHSDPVDRLLIAQAVAEPLRLLTADAALVQYSELVELV
jgi:PIN domain nuclease of toxin-antitoxin system